MCYIIPMLIFLLSEKPLVLNHYNLQPPLEVLLLRVDCHFDAHLRLKIRQCYNQHTYRMTTFDIN